ncbi:hypothetical protein [Actinomycetospora sp. NBRC 106375]|uniref:hypothetical protein n=1 Tax=Actinomycetospora sp. NBRC 106375 TaxID=3032207 RepID=UPI002553F7D8|nr:hypothetical protein [Actinomycetospora sp. NBRC 106375]
MGGGVANARRCRHRHRRATVRGIPVGPGSWRVRACQDADVSPADGLPLTGERTVPGLDVENYWLPGT